MHAHQTPQKVLVHLDSRRWPWKSESAKECVTTHGPNELALKMDGAQACYPYLAVGVETMPRRVGRRGGP
ncbi:hypothetical protein BO70DRAFT_407992 [Aspergillus heteromorphus CBS 117.55]|uniref:Uncharacterized protein n=1 Tax=Aspergillus heteromorphus CBS 117.55 TaxID=1448321 RepID=A0A317UK16_9EURO|nr:uncharacterized protein BO70DRAFT_407992 [Aspergillus heteromorphus CBS 117.55]PWY61735.1 hypothetical protein BO70DRAFT_407992 [Aspergillus heteromorphus CBS 117.55]